MAKRTNNLPMSFVALSRPNLIHNFKALKSQTKKGTKISVAIKGNAYGHGQNDVAKILDPYADYFQLNSVEELALLRKVSKKKVLLLGYVQKVDLSEAIKLECILSVFSLEQLRNISAMALIQKVKQEVHLSIDAHLGREGFMPGELKEVLLEIKKLKNIKLTGMYAHFANIEDTTNSTHAKKQIKEYEKVLKIAEKLGYKDLQRHMSSTSGLLVYEKNTGRNDIIRLGIGVYGLWPSRHIKFLYKGPPSHKASAERSKLELKPVLSWKTKVAQIKTLPAGHTVGYGLTYMTYTPTKIALIPQGYADGLDRRLSNKGEVLIRGTKCKIIGRVSMNMCTVDATHLKDVVLEDEVVILGTQGLKKIDAEELAENMSTINYEVTTRISALLPRIVV